MVKEPFLTWEEICMSFSKKWLGVEGLKKPPAGLHDLMQRCWDEKPDNRPDARECHERLTQLYQEVSAPSS